MTRMLCAAFVLIVALLLVAQPGQAQKKTKGQLPQGWKDLGLSDEQRLNVYKVKAEYKVKMDELKAKERELQLAEKAELAKILTPEQKKKLAAALLGETEGTKKKVEKSEKTDKKD